MQEPRVPRYKLPDEYYEYILLLQRKLIICLIVQPNHFIPASNWILKPLAVSVSSDRKFMNMSLPVEGMAKFRENCCAVPVTRAISLADWLSPSWTDTKSKLKCRI